MKPAVFFQHVNSFSPCTAITLNTSTRRNKLQVQKKIEMSNSLLLLHIEVGGDQHMLLSGPHKSLEQHFCCGFFLKICCIYLFFLFDIFIEFSYNKNLFRKREDMQIQIEQESGET